MPEILRKKACPLFLLFLGALCFPLVLSSGVAGTEEKESAPRGRGCLGCHEGIEVINARMAASWGADRKCEICHGGNPTAATKLEAHAGLIANPGDLRVIERTCGKCHSDYGELSVIKIGGIGNHVGRVMRSLMATAAGEIAGTRYLWNAQDTRSAIYGVRAVVDLDRHRPEIGAVDMLQQLPPATTSHADSLLRGECLRCHLWTEDMTTPGIFRPAGCSACHVPYASDGLSASGDAAIPKDEPGHPEAHVITTAVRDSQCLGCHNNGGARIGLSYVGLAVTNPSLGHAVCEPGGRAAYGATVIQKKPDVHYRKGMSCIDCHDTVDLHGDGNIYTHQEYQVGIRCETCHGSWDKAPTFRTEHGRGLANVEFSKERPFLRAKATGERLAIPTLFQQGPDGQGPSAIWHRGHQRLECYACHSERTTQCYACHIVRDDRQSSPVDWVLGVGEGRTAEPSVGRWTGRNLMQQWDEPVLGYNRRNRIAPFMPGGQAILTHIDAQGKEVVSNGTVETSAGLYGFSMSPVQPHNITLESRTCTSCHSSKRALGLGGDLMDLKALGLPLNFSPDRIVDEEGFRIQDSAHDGVRPFDRDDLANVFRTGACITCHEDAAGPRDAAADTPVTLEGADEHHHTLMNEASKPKER
jgi:hypothetical protein